MVATKSAGLGIDKQNVRYVIDADIPSSLKEFFQEAGRASRGGMSSAVILFHRPENKSVHVKHIGEAKEDSVREASINRLNALISFENSNNCRFVLLERYFGERNTDPCGRCDNCKSPPVTEKVIVTEEAKSLIRVCLAVQNLVKGASSSLIAKVFVGSVERDVTKNKLNDLSLHGIGRSLSLKEADEIIHLLVSKGHLKEIVEPRSESQYGGSYLKVTTSGSEFLESIIECDVIRERVVKRI